MKSKIIDMIDFFSLKMDYIKSYSIILENTLMVIDSKEDIRTSVDISYATIYAMKNVIDEIEEYMDNCLKKWCYYISLSLRLISLCSNSDKLQSSIFLLLSSFNCDKGRKIV